MDLLKLYEKETGNFERASTGFIYNPRYEQHLEACIEWINQRLRAGQVEMHCYTPKFIKDEELVHTKRLTYLAEQIGKAQQGISDCNDQLRNVDGYRKEIQGVYKAEILTKKARFEFELNESLEGLFNFCDGLREGV